MAGRIVGNVIDEHGSRAVRDPGCVTCLVVRVVERVAVRLVRPPFGKDRRRINSVARELGLVTALWSIDSGDARYFTTDEVVATVVQHAAPGEIVLMHDGGLRRDTTLTALETLLPQLRERGFELVTISELLELPARGPAAFATQRPPS